jgi:nucleotide-binding universal stress UspA family protein
MFNNILLAVDGSEASMDAAKMAAEIARCNPGILRIVVAFDPVPAYLGEPNLQIAITARLNAAEAVLERAVQTIGATPIEIHTEILQGPAAEAILQVAQTRGNDLIVMGSRGMEQLTGLLLGSQTQKVVNHAPCPVLIVR